MKKKLASVIAAAGAIALLAGCASGDNGNGSDNGGDNGNSGDAGITSLSVGWAEFAPYFHIDPASNDVTGLNVDITNAIGENMGAEVSYVMDAWPTLMLGLASDKYDATFVAFTPERAEQGDFSDSIYETDYTFAVRADEDWEDLADLDIAGNTIAVTTGSSTDSILTANVQNAEILRLRDVGAVMLALKNGDADAMATTRDYITNVAASDDSIRVLDSAFAVSEFGFAVKKGNTELLNALNEQIKAVKASGLIQQAIEDHELVGVTVSD